MRGANRHRRHGEAQSPRFSKRWNGCSGCEALLFKNDSSAREMEGLPSYVEPAMGNFDELGKVVEDGLEFHVPLAEGQKTGWFFDQAANRRALTKYVRKGARVLDVFSYVGAWGVRAAQARAREVLCVDSSAPALELAASNAERNGVKLTPVKGDAFDVLEDLRQEARAIRCRHRRSAGVRQAQEGPAEGAGRLQTAEPAGHAGAWPMTAFWCPAPARTMSSAEELAGRDRQGGARGRQARADSGDAAARRPITRCIRPSPRPAI